MGQSTPTINLVLKILREQGYKGTGYITSSYKEFFNAGKKAEVEDRVIHNEVGNIDELADL